MKPDFSRQSAEPMTADERKEWFIEAGQAMHKDGAIWFQYSVDDADNPTIALIEGWERRPETQPKPCFHLAPGARVGR